MLEQCMSSKAEMMWKNSSCKGQRSHEVQIKCEALPSSQGAHESMTPSLADLRMDSGRGMECLTMAPYRPYSAITVLRPQHFSFFLHLARRFWNQTCTRRETSFSEFLDLINLSWLL